MTHITRTAPLSETPLGAASLYHTVVLAEALVSGLRANWLAYRTRKALTALSNDQLADIGLERAQITLAAAQASR